MKQKHPIQLGILKLKKSGYKVESIGYRALGKLIAEPEDGDLIHPQRVKYHYQQLVRDGLVPNRTGKNISSKYVNRKIVSVEQIFEKHEIVTLKQAARLTGRKLSDLIQAVAQKDLKAFSVEGIWLIRLDDVKRS